MLALIAGRGKLPDVIFQAQETPPLVCATVGAMPDTLRPDVTFRLETLGSLLIDLGNRGITQVCFAGALERPAFDPSALDAETAPLVPLFLEGLKKGDDGALRVIVDLFEKTGFSVIGAHDLVPDILAQGGVLSESWPDAQMRADSEVGAAYLAEMGPRDIGQACIVAGGKVLAMEDIKGTDALILGVASKAKGKGAILFKAPKPDQLRVIDLPAIGPDTVRNAITAGLRGIVVDADDVVMLERAECKALADEAGLVIWARTGE